MSWLSERFPSIVGEIDFTTASRLGLQLLVGGLLGWFVRVLYVRFSSSLSNADSFSSTFPLLTVVTIAVIAVVKSSLALSLGLVGALSIVRFRAAIKDPEELVYLFLCIGVGLAVGAGHVLYAAVLVFVASIFIVARHALSRRSQRQNVMLTVSGDVKDFEGGQKGVLAILKDVEDVTIQRLELEEKQGLVRAFVERATPEEATEIVQKLRKRLPKCELSYVNTDALL